MLFKARKAVFCTLMVLYVKSSMSELEGCRVKVNLVMTAGKIFVA